MKHKLSVEILHHLQCGSCQQWWTIGDCQIKGSQHCPKCGVKAEVEEIKDSDDPFEPDLIGARPTKPTG